MYPYHNKIKQRIRNSELTGYEYVEKYKSISPCLLLYFNTDPKIKYQDKILVFMADLVPTVGHIPVPYVTGFDTRPLLSMNEKAQFMNTAADNNYYLFLEHDAHNQICTVKHTEKGVRVNDVFTFEELFG